MRNAPTRMPTVDPPHYFRRMTSCVRRLGASAARQLLAEYAKSSPRHQREHTPAEILTRVGGVALGLRGELGSNVCREFVAGIAFKPSAHGEPFGRLVSVPAVLVGQNHLNDVVAEVAERREQFRKHEEVGDRVCATSPGNIFGRRWLPPEGLADEDDPSGAQAPRQKLDGAGDSPADPGGSDAGCHLDLIVGDVARSVAMDELDPIGDAEFFGTESCLLGEQLAHVDAGAGDAVIACPGTQHLPRTAAEVEHAGPRLHAQRRAESGELLGCDRVVDAVSGLGDVEYPWDVHRGRPPYR